MRLPLFTHRAAVLIIRDVPLYTYLAYIVLSSSSGSCLYHAIIRIIIDGQLSINPPKLCHSPLLFLNDFNGTQLFTTLWMESLKVLFIILESRNQDDDKYDEDQDDEYEHGLPISNHADTIRSAASSLRLLIIPTFASCSITCSTALHCTERQFQWCFLNWIAYQCSSLQWTAPCNIMFKKKTSEWIGEHLKHSHYNCF